MRGRSECAGLPQGVGQGPGAPARPTLTSRLPQRPRCPVLLVLSVGAPVDLVCGHAVAL